MKIDLDLIVNLLMDESIIKDIKDPRRKKIQSFFYETICKIRETIDDDQVLFLWVFYYANGPLERVTIMYNLEMFPEKDDIEYWLDLDEHSESTAQELALNVLANKGIEYDYSFSFQGVDLSFFLESTFETPQEFLMDCWESSVMEFWRNTEALLLASDGSSIPIDLKRGRYISKSVADINERKYYQDLGDAT